MMTELNLLLLGVVVMGCLVAALFFLRFWRHTKDRLFGFFAAAFAFLAIHWILLALTQPNNVLRPAFYLVRLVAFALIAIGVVDKNRRGRSSRPPNDVDPG